MRAEQSEPSSQELVPFLTHLNGLRDTRLIREKSSLSWNGAERFGAEIISSALALPIHVGSRRNPLVARFQFMLFSTIDKSHVWSASGRRVSRIQLAWIRFVLPVSTKLTV